MTDFKSEYENFIRDKKHISEEQKDIIVKGIEYWMDKQFARFGRWTAFWLLSGVFGYFVLFKIKMFGVN